MKKLRFSTAVAASFIMVGACASGASAAPATCGSVYDFFFSACPLTWYGVTVYGTVDMGGAYETHGAPFDPNHPTGELYLLGAGGTGAVNRLPGFFVAPNGMSQSNVGIKINEPVVGGWSFVGQGELAFTPYSFLLSNAPQSLQNGIGEAENLQSEPYDSSRWGWLAGPINAGVSHPVFGTLTFGRMNDLYNDNIVAYDPMGASYAFSPIGFSGKSCGAGDTEECRWTTAIKYRVNIGDWRFSVQGQPITGNGYGAFNPNNGAVDGDIGVDKHIGPGVLSVDLAAAWIRDAVNISTSFPGQATVGGWPTSFPADGMLKATISNQQSIYLFVKYNFGGYSSAPVVSKAPPAPSGIPLTLYAGYEYINFSNPSDPQSAFRDDGFLFVATSVLGTKPLAFTGNGTFINNNAFNGNCQNAGAGGCTNEVFMIMWTGFKYGITKDLDIVSAYYHYIQNQYTVPTVCVSAVGGPANNSSCAGWFDTASLVLDWRFLPKWDWYLGTMYSAAYGGIANGDITRNNVSTVTGVRFRF